MKKLFFSIIIFVCHLVATAQKNYTQLVNPFIGTGGHGHTFPGASVPFGMMQLSPDTRMADWDGSSGYHYSDSLIYGFSHTHLSGTGIPDYCDILMMPFTGDVKWKNTEYRSTFSHKNEKASPGYYEVLLDKGNIKAQLTTTARAGIHQYTFPSNTNSGGILIDLQHRDQVLESFIEKVNDREIRGMRRSKSWAQNQHVYFHIVFSEPITVFAILDDAENVVHTSITQGKKIKAFVKFALKDKMVKAKVGISGVSLEGAKLNVDTEIPAFDFNDVRNNATKLWNKELSKIEVTGGTEDQQKVFYTALYHTMLSPNIYQDVDDMYRSTDLKVHKATNFTNYTVFSLWDTYRAYHPLMTILDQKRTTDWINTFLTQYKYGGMLPVWELSANETFCMIGYHSVPVIFDAYQKGIRGFDTGLALTAMTDYAESNRFGLPYYIAQGYLSNEKEHESVSKTLEYAYDDWCIAQYAKALGKMDVYKKYIQRAQNYKNIFDKSTLHMRGKLQSMWYSPFDAKEINNFYTEGNSWHYSFAAPQDITGMINLYGGEESFTKKLDELFNTSSKTTGRDQADVTGLIGQYAQGNEPSHHMAYLFNYVGKPWRTQEIIHKIMNEFYTNAPDGLIGNEDCGQMSAWYIFSAMGFYPVTPGSGNYALGTPFFYEIKIKLENGKTFTIKAHKQSPGSFYVDNVQVNGKGHTKSYIDHSVIMNGGLLEFWLKDEPNKEFGKKQIDRPETSIKDHPIIPVPFFAGESNKFKDEKTVDIKCYDEKAEVFYFVADSVNQVFSPKLYKRYTGPFAINKNCTVIAFAKNKEYQTPAVMQTFYKVPTDKNITVISKVHPMYTAGGIDALIDGIKGTTNWKTGEWQSYFDTDFEAIIDLQNVKQVNYAGVHVLQDVSPWIVYPTEVIFYTSNDGKDYKEAARVKNMVDKKLETVQTQEIGTALNVKARYIKVVAVSGGKLPEWHESAGNPSHLFIDEVIIK